MNQTELLHRAEAVTPAERYLKQLADRTFLSLWSYVGIYRDQGVGGGKEGKEVCDLLVVFEDHIIIFSDKDCAFPDTGKLDVDWGRWYRHAVRDGTKQLWGAERWIREFPSRLFLDRACTKPFPIVLPDLAKAKVHRIVVAHGASQRCFDYHGGSGSLMLDSGWVGNQHDAGADGRIRPFVIGQVDPTKGFVHVLDDTTLHIVLQTLDTISDFVAYLTKKDQLFQGRQRVRTAGEEELLALYLMKTNKQGEHEFRLPKAMDTVLIVEGEWDAFVRSPQRQRQVLANDVSYSWDRLIEKFNHHFYSGTRYHATDKSVEAHERIMRWLAREPRTRRRMLIESLFSVIRAAKPEQMMTRVVAPGQPGDPFYVFLALARPRSVSNEKYRQGRRAFLEAYCLVTKLTFPAAEHIVGIATEAAWEKNRSEDAMYYDAREWTWEEQDEARWWQQELKLLQHGTAFRGKFHEYPSERELRGDPQGKVHNQLGSFPRKWPCPCGSRKKYKHCCGRG